MSTWYVVYDVETTRLVKNKNRSEYCKSKGAATRLKNEAELKNPDRAYAVAEVGDFHENIELMVERVNLMSGKTYMERVNTSNACSPASETYWSM